METIKGRVVAVLAGCGIALACWSSNGVANAQTPPVNLPPGVQDVVKLSQAGLSEDVILSQVRNAGATYNLSADQLIYVSKAGVSQNVIRALMANNGAGATAPVPAPLNPVPSTPPSAPPMAPPSGELQPATAAPTGPPGAEGPPPTFDSFQQQLAPYGAWVQAPGYGMVWRPSVAFDPHWRPYGNEGHWTYTADGWYWDSDYPWGGIAFHYGRWFRDPQGWFWVPGYNWAPAWVTWRHADGYVGWAPLPPAAVFRPGIGLEFNGALAVDVDFGLGPDAFTFVGYDHFWDHDLRPFYIPHDRVIGIFRHSVIVNGYRFDHGRFVIDGLGRDRIGLYTHHEVRIEVPLFHDDHGFRRGPDRGFRDDRRDFHDDRHDGFH